MKEKLLLAYSGGLDTSIILKWLINKGFEVTAFIVDVGQEENFELAKNKALLIGAKDVVIADCKLDFVENYIYPAICANAIFEGRYLLGTSLARPVIAKKMAEYALNNNITYVSHGATGKGNDQIRFELVFLQFIPNVKIIAPWKDKEFLTKFTGRTDLLNYASENNIPVSSTLAKPYSIDENLMHTSFEAGILEDPLQTPPDDMFKKTVSPFLAPDKKQTFSLEFKSGIAIKVIDKTNNITITNQLELFNYLNMAGGNNGIGRIDIVESRFVGMKSRGVYETPAGTILHLAHLDLETITLDREVLLMKQIQAPKIAQLIYNGFWFSPEMDMLMAAVKQTQEFVTGIVNFSLYKGNVIIEGRSSPYSLYNPDIASMDKLGEYDQTDAIGFIKLNALRLSSNHTQKQNIYNSDNNPYE